MSTDPLTCGNRSSSISSCLRKCFLEHENLSGSKESIVDLSEALRFRKTAVKSSSTIVKRAATPLRTSEKRLSDPSSRKLDLLGESP